MSSPIIMLRVVYHGPLFLRIAAAGTLVVWIGLFAYLTVFTAPPLAAVLLLLLPLLLIAWVLSLLNRGVLWEVSDTQFRKTIGEKVLVEVPWKDVKALSARGNPADEMAVLSIVDKNGKGRLNAVPGVGLSFDDVKALYQAAAHYVRAFGIETRNNLGWEPAAPIIPERKALSERINVLPHVSTSLIASGLLILATASYAARPPSSAIGLVLVAFGIVLLAGSYLVRRRGRPAMFRRLLIGPLP